MILKTVLKGNDKSEKTEIIVITDYKGESLTRDENKNRHENLCDKVTLAMGESVCFIYRLKVK